MRSIRRVHSSYEELSRPSSSSLHDLDSDDAIMLRQSCNGVRCNESSRYRRKYELNTFVVLLFFVIVLASEENSGARALAVSNVDEIFPDYNALRLPDYRKLDEEADKNDDQNEEEGNDDENDEDEDNDENQDNDDQVDEDEQQEEQDDKEEQDDEVEEEQDNDAQNDNYDKEDEKDNRDEKDEMEIEQDDFFEDKLADDAVADNSFSSNTRRYDDDFYAYVGDPAPPTLFPLQDRYIIGYIVSAMALTLGASGGIGGGGIVVPVCLLVMGLGPKAAMGVGSVTILGGSLSSTILNTHRRHPLADRPLIDWDLILVMQPVVL